MATAEYRPDDVVVSDEARHQLFEFFRQRLRGILIDDHGIDAQVADVTLGAGFEVPADALRRATGMSALPADTRAVFKRIGNILDDARAKGYAKQAEPVAGKFVAPTSSARCTRRTPPSPARSPRASPPRATPRRSPTSPSSVRRSQRSLIRAA